MLPVVVYGDLQHTLPPFVAPHASVDNVSVRLSSFDSVLVPQLLVSLHPSSFLDSQPSLAQPTSSVPPKPDSAPFLDSLHSSLQALTPPLPSLPPPPPSPNPSLYTFKTASSPPNTDLVSFDNFDASPLLSSSLDTPWYAEMKDTLLSSRPVSPSNSISYPLCALLAVSSSHPDPVAAFNLLHANTSPEEIFKDKPWIDPHLLRYYVLVHDTDTPPPTHILDHIKRLYGVHSALLVLSSDSHKNDLSVKAFVRELVVQSIVPTLERSVQQLNDQISAARKGITGRLFSAGRRYFGATTGRSSPSSASAYNPVQGFYPYSSQEAQTRKLADLAFVIHDYNLATSMYDYCRKDFSRDKATSYYASACRMLGLSQILQAQQTATTPPREALVHFEEALSTNTSSISLGSSELDDLRAAVSYHQAYQAINDLRFVPSLFTQVAGQIESVSSAILLEQAAIADLTQGNTTNTKENGSKRSASRRKFAFHMLMAANRYEALKLYKFANRCLFLADWVYSTCEWSLIRQTIDHAIAKHEFDAGNYGVAVEKLGRLVRNLNLNLNNGEHESFVSFLVLALDKLRQVEPDSPLLQSISFNQPIFRTNCIKVRRRNLNPSTTNNHNPTSSTALFESPTTPTIKSLDSFEKALKRVSGDVNSNNNNAIRVRRIPEDCNVEITINETFDIQLAARNPINSTLVMSSIKLEYRYGEGNEENSSSLDYVAPQSVTLEPLSSSTISFACTTKALGIFKLDKISYVINDNIFLTDNLDSTITTHATKSKLSASPSIKRTKSKKKKSKSSAVFILSSIEPRPCISVSFDHEIPNQLLAGQIYSGSLNICNTGLKDINQLYLFCNRPDIMSVPASASSSSSFVAQDSQKLSPSHFNIQNAYWRNTPVKVFSTQETEQADRGTDKASDIIATVDFSICVDTPNQYDLLISCAYSSIDDPNMFDVLQFSKKIKVIPSFEFRPTIHVPISADHAYTMNLETYNPFSSYTCVIDKVVAISSTWAVCLRQTGTQSPVGSVSTLEPQQTSTTIFDIDESTNRMLSSSIDEESRIQKQLKAFLTRHNNNDQADQVDDIRNNEDQVSLCVSTTGNSPDNIPVLIESLLPRRSFRRLKHLKEMYPVMQRIRNSTANDDEDTPLKYIFPFFSCRSLDIIIQWKATKASPSTPIPTTIKGQTSIFDLKVGASHNHIRECIDDVLKSMSGGGIVGMLEESRAEKRMIIDGIRKSDLWIEEECLRVCVESDNIVDLSKSSSKFTKVDVKFWLRNLSPTKTLTYKMELDSKSLSRSSATTTISSLQSSMQATPWVGMLVYNGYLKPLEKTVHVATMYVSNIGVYDVGRCFVKTDMGSTITFPETNVFVI